MFPLLQEPLDRPGHQVLLELVDLRDLQDLVVHQDLVVLLELLVHQDLQDLVGHLGLVVLLEHREPLGVLDLLELQDLIRVFISRQMLVVAVQQEPH